MPKVTIPVPVYYARHGETVNNVEGRWQGRNDSPLTPRGEEHALETGAILKTLLPATERPRFVASTLGRARATMEIVLKTIGLPRDAYSTDARLVEIDLGEWSGLLADDVRIRDKERFEARARDRWNVPCPSGESYAMADQRAVDWLASVTEPTVIISHGLFGRVLRCRYAGLPWQEIASMDEPHGAVFRLQNGTIAKFTV